MRIAGMKHESDTHGPGRRGGVSRGRGCRRRFNRLPARAHRRGPRASLRRRSPYPLTARGAEGSRREIIVARS